MTLATPSPSRVKGTNSPLFILRQAKAMLTLFVRLWYGSFHFAFPLPLCLFHELSFVRGAKTWILAFVAAATVAYAAAALRWNGLCVL